MQKYTRTLLYFPIIHTEDDMGSLAEKVRKANLVKLGREAWGEKVLAIKALWGRTASSIKGMNLDLSKVRLYQDGLPVCGREAEIVMDIAANGSLNHRLLLELHQGGGVIMGTESFELLYEEYNLTKLSESGQEGGRNENITAQIEFLLTKRDHFIAARINNTLLSAETGILFIGILHSLEGLLAEDIFVTYPIGRPLIRGTNDGE